MSSTSIFAGEAHRDFFMEKVEALNADVYLKALIYTVGIDPTTRKNWGAFYSESDRCILPDVINKGWQTSETMRVTRMAFQLFTDGTPTAFTEDRKGTHEDFKECSRYSVSDIFCSHYAPLFMQAVQIRYPEYCRQVQITPMSRVTEREGLEAKLERAQKAYDAQNATRSAPTRDTPTRNPER